MTKTSDDCHMCSRPHSEWQHTMEFRQKHNLWDHIKYVIDVLNDPKWFWFNSSHCKYLDVRIDMRDGGCIIKNIDGKRISPKQLKYQYSAKNPEAPSDDEAYE